MSKKRFMPVGAAVLIFEHTGSKKIRISEDGPTFVESFADAEEVLTGTIPYFMRDNFGYTSRSK